MRVLVIEDSVRLQRALGTALRKSGYVVDLSGDGEEGLWLANSNNYDVIVLDLMLPKLPEWRNCCTWNRHCFVGQFV